MTYVIGVRFQQDGKIFYYNAMDLTPRVGDYIIVNSGKGLDLGEVILGIQELNEEQLKSPLPQVVRLATAQDIQRATDNRAKEREAYKICQRKIAEHNLEMKLVSVESSFDNSKMLFYFTANGRVDFRALVKDLASVFRTRIELRQIGVRDEARMLGGLGPCGRTICCGAFLSDFQPVSIKMAKEQNLSLNPTKISGVCGRLMCCLKYEQDQYEQTRKRMPRIGREVMTPDGAGTVSDLNVVKETVSVRIPNGDIFEVREYTLDKIMKTGQTNPEPAEENRPDYTGDSEEKNAGMELSARESEQNRTENAAVHEEKTASEPVAPRPSKPRNTDRAGRHAQKKNIDETDKEKKGAALKSANVNRKKKQNSTAVPVKQSKEQKFGQPVMRENQNKDRSSGGSYVTQPPASSVIEKADPPKPVQRKRSGWADAVEKALAETEH